MRRTIALAGLALALGSSGALAAPAPASPAQVAAAVRSSASVKDVSAAVARQLTTDQTTQHLYPATTTGCSTATSCVFGDKASRTTWVLLGDSHALMWLPALDPIAQARRARLVVLWDSTCPVAALSGLSYQDYDKVGVENPGCAAWRSSAVGIARRLRPAATILGERTAGAELVGKAVPEATWQAALERTLRQLPHPVMLQDVGFFDSPVPLCLAASPSNVQSCSVPWPNAKYPGEQPAERAAAKAVGAPLVATAQWFCKPRSCSPVVGAYAVFYDEGHVAADYAQWLRGVLGAALRKAIP